MTASLDDLDDHFQVCRFPLGRRAYSYCARPTVPGTSYCDEHLRRCYHILPARARIRAAEVLPIKVTEDVA